MGGIFYTPTIKFFNRHKSEKEYRDVALLHLYKGSG